MDIFAVYNASAWAAQQQQGGPSSNSSATDDPERAPLIRITDTGMVQYPCIPPALMDNAGSLQIVSKQLCPDVPYLRIYLAQDNCTNSSSASAFSQCWAAKHEGSTSGYGSAPTDTFGVGIPAHYSACVARSYILCGSVMTDECISSSGGLVACYFRMQNQGQQEYALRDEAAHASSSPPPAAVEPSTAVLPEGNGGGGGSQTAVLAAAVAGAVGGAALLAVLLYVIYVRRRRHRQQRKSADTECPKGASPYSVRSSRHSKPSSKPSPQVAANLASGDLSGHDLEDMAPEDLPSAGLKGRGSNPHAPPTPAIHGEHKRQATAASNALSPDLLSGDRKQQASPPLLRQRPDLMQLELLTPKSPFVAGIDLGVSVHEEGQKGLQADGVFLSDETLGRGAYGRVVKGTYYGQPVAVKLLNCGLLPPVGPADGPIAVEPVAPPAAGGSTSSTVPVGSACTERDAHPSAEASADVNAVVPTTPSDGNSAQEAPVAASQMARGLTVQERSLRQEVEVLARCQHPNIVRLLAASMTPRRVCLVMELMECSLERVLYGSGAQPLPLQTVLHIGTQVANALAYLHPTVLHRDLKPANILISAPHSERPIVKIADFGVSRLLTSVLITANPEVGTAAYMANETFDLGNSVITDRVDIYSLAVILWEMLAGQRPWAEYTSIVALAFRVTVCNDRPPLTGLSSRAPAKLVKYISLMWSAEPLRRPSAADVWKMLTLISQALAAGSYAEEGDYDPKPAVGA